jgi:hypothetical protein
MTRRKLVAAALFFTVFGALAYLPPLVLLFRLDQRVLGVPIETVYVFALWAVLVGGARWFSRVLPDERAPHEKHEKPSVKPGSAAP